MKLKKYCQLLLLMLPMLVVGQKKVAEKISMLKHAAVKFEKLQVLKACEVPANKINPVVKDASYATIALEELNKVFEHQYENIQIQIPYKGQFIEIELFQTQPFSSGFHADTDQKKQINYSNGLHYRGIVKGNINSIAAFNFFKNELNGIVSSSELGNINIGKLLKETQQYIIYADRDLLAEANFTCHTNEVSNRNEFDLNRSNNPTNEKIVNVYLEVGYQAYQANNNDLTTTLNWITAIFNNVQTLFENDGIAISLKSVFIWTIDDYYRLSGNYIIPAFTNIRPYFDGDVGFIADIDPAGLGGQAFGIGTLCSERNYAYGDLYFEFNSVPNYSKSVNYIAHELGHVLGSHHTHACFWNGNNTAIDGCAQTYGGCITPVNPPDFQGTIMSYCNNLLFMGFGEQPANAIRQHIESASCISANGGENCMNTIGKIDALNVTQTSTTITWTDSDANNLEWDFSIVPYGEIPQFITTSSTVHLIENLNPNTYYEVVLKGRCQNGLTYPKRSRVFATQGENCDGIQIFDTGGSLNPYQINEHLIRTIVPTVPNKKIKIVFNNVNLLPFDSQVYIYDGLDTNGPLINRLSAGLPFRASAQNNSATPSSIVSQDPSGALTLEFFSRQDIFNTTVYNGWTATVSCLNTLGNDAFGDGFIDYSFGPNPVIDLLNIQSKELIENLEIYNLEGKLLLSKSVGSKQHKLDVSTLSANAYLVKLYFEKNSASFKIVKN